MRIEELAVSVRPRKSVEAVDLGIHMVRSWAFAVYFPFLIVLLPFWVGLCFIFPESPHWVIFFLWWFKPFWDRVPLFVLSRAMFGTPPRVIDTLRALPGMLRYPWLGAMTFFRFTPNRAILLPVVMLEGLAGERRRRRKSLIGRELLSFAFLLNIVFVLFEWFVLYFGLFILAHLLVPGTMGDELFSAPYSQVENLAVSLFYFLSIWLLEPFFVGASFSLYLNCRTKLEGWHVELAFRRLANRLREEMGRVALVVIGLLALAVDVDAQEDYEQRSRTEIDQILSDPVFGTSETKEGWFLKDFGKSDRQTKEIDPAVSSFVDFFAGIFRLLIWGIGIFVVFLIVYFILKVLTNFRMGGKPPPKNQEEKLVLFGKVVDPDALPADIPAAAAQLFAQGEIRAAMSLLFRGALIELTLSGKLEFEDFATEEECLRLAGRKLDSAHMDFLTELTRAWQAVAYAHRTPATELFERLCGQWRQLLRGAA